MSKSAMPQLDLTTVSDLSGLLEALQVFTYLLDKKHSETRSDHYDLRRLAKDTHEAGLMDRLPIIEAKIAEAEAQKIVQKETLERSRILVHRIELEQKTAELLGELANEDGLFAELKVKAAELRPIETKPDEAPRRTEKLAAATTTGFLVVLVAQRHVRFHRLLLNQTMTLGRSSTADIQLENHSVSRIHAAIRDQSNTLWVRDLHSKNGIANKGEPAVEFELASEEIFTIGEMQLLYLAKGYPVELFPDLEMPIEDSGLTQKMMAVIESTYTDEQPKL